MTPIPVWPPPQHSRLRQLWGVTLDGVARLPVTLTGAWTLAPKYESRWRGSLIASQPIVALAALADAADVWWAKSSCAGLNLSLSISLRRATLDPADARQFVSVAAEGEAQQRRLRLPSVEYLPSVLSQQHILSGQFSRLAVVEGQPRLELGVLVLVRDDIQFVRKHIWRLRKGIRPNVDDALAWMLHYRRRGEIRLGTPN